MTKEQTYDVFMTKIILSIIGIIGLFLVLGIVLTTVTYRIDTGQGAILTKWNGEKVPINEVGWKFKLLFAEDYTKYSIVNNRIYFPADYINLETNWKPDAQTGSIGYDINTPDNKVVDVAGMVQYEITDLVQWGVLNTNPIEMFQKSVDGEFFNVLQSKSFNSDDIIHNQVIVENEILKALKGSNIEKQYGVKFNKVQLIRPTFTKEALDALSTKQAMLTIAEGELLAAEKKANATRTIANAEQYKAELLKNYPAYVLNYNANIELYKVLGDKERKDATVYVIQPSTNGDNPSVVLPNK